MAACPLPVTLRPADVLPAWTAPKVKFPSGRLTATSVRASKWLKLGECPVAGTVTDRVLTATRSLSFTPLVGTLGSSVCSVPQLPCGVSLVRVRSCAGSC